MDGKPKQKRRSERKEEKPIAYQKFWENVPAVFFGILFCVALIGISLKPSSRLILLLLAVSGGGMNLFNGMKLYRKPKQRNQGMSMLLLGAVIVMIGLYLLIAD